LYATLAGQIYLPVVVARLVGLHAAPPTRDTTGPSNT
jgi:hypothetical protein